MGSSDEEWKDYDPNVPLSPWWYTTDPARMVGMRLVRSSVPLPETTIRSFWNVDNDDTKEDIEYRLKEGRGVLGKPVPELTQEFKRKR
jgi:formylglycine-generating enzyme